MVPSPNKNPVFVPSPRWLSESPARPGTLTHIDFDGERTPSSQRSRDRSQTLWSPAPPPPANLYPEGAATFNVDPGVPFLATAGPTDAGSSEGGSIKEESPRDKRFVGGFVTGIKKAVRNSLRRSQRTEPPLPMYAQPPQFRDSGYAGSTSQLDPPPPIAPPQHARSSSSPSYDSPARPPSETLIGHTTHHPKLHDQATVVGHQEIFPPESMESPVSAETVYGPDYIGMTPPHPESDTSLRSYLKRASKLVYEISALPWVAPERVTVDYYPERSKRCDEPERHPAIVWAHQNFSAHDYLQNHPGGVGLDSGSEMSSPIENFMAPRRRTSYGDMDPDDDFGEYDPEEQRSTYSSPHAEYFNRPPPSIWPDRDQYTPRPYTYDPTWAGATSQVQHPPVGLWQTVGTNPSPRQPSLQPQPRPPSQPTSHRSPHATPSRAQHRIPTPSMPPPRSAPPSDRGSWQQYPPEMGGYVPYEFAEHYYGDRYGPGVHAARPPVPGAHSSARTSMASVRDQQPPIPVGSSRV
ncbi:hypothetical protein M413DRAFT_447574 [Hebeloma cylindrosporum]|uniref:Uncharacterized protein n=1 Tax=Hebeloma cylindrosporum TaxID=76867 RepID=A0A0C2YCY4_HEBCY|nr:hypothetical protein M413DRAFT_447574 [Hebeloma cylindrosporum h7]